MRRTALVIALLVLAAGCRGGGSIAPKPPASDTGIQGIVLLGPTCPVQQQGSDCDDRPVSVVVRVIRVSTGARVASVTSGVDGRFEINLTPGSYLVQAVPSDAAQSSAPITIAVTAGQIAEITLQIDSGIR